MATKIVSLLAVVLVWGASVAHADVPKPEDVATCNREALESRTASPTAGDESRAAVARRDAPPAVGGVAAARSADPQLDGMDGEGAKDPAYQAAYRTCMRRRGF